MPSTKRLRRHLARRCERVHICGEDWPCALNNWCGVTQALAPNRQPMAQTPLHKARHDIWRGHWAGRNSVWVLVRSCDGLCALQNKIWQFYQLLRRYVNESKYSDDYKLAASLDRPDQLHARRQSVEIQESCLSRDPRDSGLASQIELGETDLERRAKIEWPDVDKYEDTRWGSQVRSKEPWRLQSD